MFLRVYRVAQRLQHSNVFVKSIQAMCFFNGQGPVRFYSSIVVLSYDSPAQASMAMFFGDVGGD